MPSKTRTIVLSFYAQACCQNFQQNFGDVSVRFFVVLKVAHFPSANAKIPSEKSTWQDGDSCQ